MIVLLEQGAADKVANCPAPRGNVSGAAAATCNFRADVPYL